MDYEYKYVKEKHLLTEENKKIRVEFCKMYMNKKCDNIWYSDESIFMLEE